MTINEIVSRAASAYPDGFVLQYWSAEGQCAISNPKGGDTLAEFIAWELYETYDPDVGDDEQLETAVRVMSSAAGDVALVTTALQHLRMERSAA